MRYIVHGGEVFSRNDGDLHYVTALQVCRLYGLRPSDPDVIVVTDYRPGLRPKPDDVHLRPLPSGRYYDVRAERP